MTDNKKITQSFQCRETLWESFVQMASELECSVDYLINDAMKQYARQRGYGGTTGHSGQHPAVQEPPKQPAIASPVPPRPFSTAPHPPTRFSGAPPPPPAPRPAPRASTVPFQPPASLQPPASRFSAVPPPQAHPARVSSSVPPAARPPSRQAPPAALGAAAPPGLSVYYNGERFSVNKERFIIGRGRQTSDLTIKDPNVSRQHAMIEYVGGEHFIVDMGSANGLEYAGQLIQRRLINDGDVFRVCDHELRFSYG